MYIIGWAGKEELAKHMHQLAGRALPVVEQREAKTLCAAAIQLVVQISQQVCSDKTDVTEMFAWQIQMLQNLVPSNTSGILGPTASKMLSSGLSPCCASQQASVIILNAC